MRTTSGTSSSTARTRSGSARSPQAVTGSSDRIEQANSAIAAFKIEGTGYKLHYDPNFADSAATGPFGDIVLGPRAFKSWSWLGSTLGHEIEVHWAQFKALGPLTGDQDRFLRELEAHRYNLANAARFGNPFYEVARHRSYEQRYYNALNEVSREKAARGKYHGE